MLRILGGQPAQYPEFACDNAERDVFYVRVFSLFIYPFVYYLFTYLPKCEVDNSQSKLHSAAGRPDRRMYGSALMSALKPRLQG